MERVEGTNIQLNRRMGKLVNTKVIDIDGETGFVCKCDCGGSRRVKRKNFNTGKITCCEDCTEKGKRPDFYIHPNPRVQVTLDNEPMAVLGIDLCVEGNRSGSLIRSLLTTFAHCIRDASTDVSFSNEQWEQLRRVVKKEPELIDGGMSPKASLIHIAEKVGSEKIEVDGMSQIQSLAVLSALRWVVDHPEAEGDWWLVKSRTED